MNYDPIHDTYTLHDPNIVANPSAAMASLASAAEFLERAPTSSSGSSAPSSSSEPRRKYTNNKCRGLKKADGDPFWRKDIQYDFLREVFDDKTPCFSNPFPPCDIPGANNNPRLTFAELYVRTLAESSKCSKVLRERLIRDVEMGKSVSKVCLLVNAGRMNTTINFVPEMRSTLRTFHSIPSLQADALYGGVKTLQDTPRLKSILKAVCEVGSTPQSFQDLLLLPPQQKPNTNVVQMIFYLSNHATWVPFYDETGASTFMDLFVNARIHPKSRALRFLWLMYTYLETSFQPGEIAANPFGSVPPPVVPLSQEELDRFDVDTDAEVRYSEHMSQLRTRYLEDEEHNSSPKRGNKKKDAHESDDDSADENESRKKPKFAVANPSPLSNIVAVSTDYTQGHIDETREIAQKSSSQDNPLASPLISKLLNELVTIMTDSNVVLPLEPLPENSVAARKDVVEKSKPIIRDVRTSSKASTASFNKKTLILGNWLYRYFAYKKTIGNKLVGIEWEDIRNDLLSGIEESVYTEFGGSLVNDVEITQWPVRDFDSCNEKLSAALQLMSYFNDWLIRREGMEKAPKGDLVLFDLVGNCVRYN